MLAITNATLVMPDHYIPNATIIVENGKISKELKFLMVQRF